jgi:radical SAM superfamily enzyme YgiQ (UPF0313 family)
MESPRWLVSEIVAPTLTVSAFCDTSSVPYCKGSRLICRIMESPISPFEVLDFICRREFDYSVVKFAEGKPLNEILGISYKLDGKIVHNPDRPQGENLDEMPWATKIYMRDLDVTRYNVPFLLHPFIALYSTRGCPAQCTFCLWPQTLSGHAWRRRSTDDVAAELAWAKQAFPEVTGGILYSM